jgi:hypothetical protein
MISASLRYLLQTGTLGLAVSLLPATQVSAQGSGVNGTAIGLDGAAGTPGGQLLLPIIRIERENRQQDLQGLFAEQSTDINLGLEFTPLDGLSLRADAWSIQEQPTPAPAVNQAASWQARLPQPYLESERGQEFGLDQSFLGNSLESKGVDLGAAYVWEAGKAGTFTLQTTATYIHDFEQRNGVVDAGAFLNDEVTLSGSPDLQGSLTLTWDIGNHSASAVTNYFDSFKDISELNVDEINALVENITTVDLQYGYNVKAGKEDRTVISFSLGIRNIFDKKTTQILNQNSRVVDQNGRVAYGSIKYQF